jgi:hypothetical protein
MTDATGRPLAPDEQALLRHLLSVPLAGADMLRRQLDTEIAASPWSGTGPSLDLLVPDSAPPAQLPDGPLPLDATVIGADGEFAGELLIWVENGRLSAIEYAWITDAPPAGLPDVAATTVAPR